MKQLTNCVMLTIATARRKGAFLLASMTLLGACGILSSGPEDELAAARERWSGKKIEAYRFRYRKSCFCPPDEVREVMISVHNNTIDSARTTDSGLVVSSENLIRYHTVEGLFGVIAKAIDQDAYRVNVTYDKENGAPTHAEIKYYENALDEGSSFDLKDLQPLQ